ncbi:MAG: hypothetical protein JRN15_23285, partial [Nitrososphaerota archaeon]|nr:hypothetical protein [Nitrososphaerota archaeon]
DGVNGWNDQTGGSYMMDCLVDGNSGAQSYSSYFAAVCSTASSGVSTPIATVSPGDSLLVTIQFTIS